jgi:outer membrane protein
MPTRSYPTVNTYYMKGLNSNRSKRSAIRAIAVALAFAPLAAISQTPTSTSSNSQVVGTALSLDDAVKMAESQSEAVSIARAGVQRTQGQQMQARSQYFPQISGTASYTRTLKSQYSGAFGGGSTDTTTKVVSPPGPCDAYLRDATASVADRLNGLEQSSRCSLGLNPFASLSSLPFGQANAYNLGLSFSQSLFTGGRVGAQNKAAAASAQSAKIELTAQRAQIILDVTQAYYDAALADRLVAITDASFTQTDIVLQQVQLNKNVGNVSEFELLRAQVTRDNQRPQVIQRRSDREVAYLRLKQLLNIPLEQPLTLTTSIEDTSGLPAGIHMAGLNVTSFEMPDTVAEHRSAVRQASEAVRAQEGLLTVARSERIPALALTSQYGGVAYPSGGLPGKSDFRANWTVGVSASVPFFTGGRIRGDEMVAQANLAESRARLQQVKEFASLDARVALNALNQAASAWEASKGTAEQATKAYTIAEVRYKEGISTQLELNDSRILLEQSNANRALAARNLQIARMKLALLSNLPLSSGTSAQSASQSQTQTQTQSTQQSASGSQQSAAGQAQQTSANQQIPPGF